MTTEWEMEVETEYFEAPSRDFNEMLVENQKFNPWDVKSLDIFCVYHCPECDYQQADQKMFRDHAIYIHDLVRFFIFYFFELFWCSSFQHFIFLLYQIYWPVESPFQPH